MISSFVSPRLVTSCTVVHQLAKSSGVILQPETLEKLIFQLLHFFQFFLNFSWLNELIEWANFFFVVDLWSVATLCKKIAVINSILAFFLKS